MAEHRKPETAFIEELQAIIRQHIGDASFSIDQLCRAAGLSRAQLHRKLKAATGLSASLFIRRERMHAARELLEQSDDNISEIAYQTGNTSPQNFSKYFIEEFGLSPSAYRKHFREQTEAETDGIPAATEKEEKRPAWWPLTGIVVAAVLVLAVLLFMISSAPFSVDESPNPESIAVLPFQTFGSEASTFLCEGIVEDILTHLASFQGLRVISRTSSAQYRNSDKNIRQIAAELGVTYVLEGSVRQYRDQVRITAQLVRADTDEHLWANSYDRQLENIMDIQSQVAQEIARALNQRISPELEKKIARTPTANLEAYNALLRGRYLLRNRTRADIEQGLVEFDEALRLDPNFSEAFAGKASAYHLLANLGYVGDEKRRYNELAEEFALMAIREDVQNARAYAVLANVYRDQYRWTEALTSYEIALDLNPGDALTNYWYALTLRAIGDLDRSLEHHRIAMMSDPLYPVIHAGYVYTCSLAGESEQAYDLLVKGRPIFSNSFLYQFVTGFHYQCTGEYDQALPYIERSLELNPDFRVAQLSRVFCLGKSGRQDEVAAFLAGLDLETAAGSLDASVAYAVLGQPDRSLQALRKAADLGQIREDMLVHPYYDGLRDHPVFGSILVDYGLSAYRQELQ